MREAVRAAPARALLGTKILVVDDEPEAGDVLVAVLSTFGALATSAVDASTAWGMTETSAFDVVITDIDMPGEDGMSLACRLRARHAELRLILLSGFAVDDAIRTLVRGGAIDAHLSKPIDMDMLVSTITRARAPRLVVG